MNYESSVEGTPLSKHKPPQKPTKFHTKGKASVAEMPLKSRQHLDTDENSVTIIGCILIRRHRKRDRNGSKWTRERLFLLETRSWSWALCSQKKCFCLGENSSLMASTNMRVHPQFLPGRLAKQWGEAGQLSRSDLATHQGNSSQVR